MSTYRYWVLAVALVIGAAIGACGGSICDRAQSVSNSLQAKSRPCSSFGDAGTSLLTLNIDKPTCEANIKQCTSSDKEALSSTLDCFDRVPACASGAELQFAFSIFGCYPNLTRITPACVQAISRH